ncbi:MAG TPA: hypothetical protein EYP36_08935, partial [Calditrichaeota bacterium]|nr:hypothetical protein [Calditrichota bacterium]
MKKIFLKMAAVLAAILGIMALFTGTRVLTGSFVPGYNVLQPLVIYNVTMGAVSVLTGILIWKSHRLAVLLSGIITIAHIVVLISLLTIFADIVARQSIMAMLFRSVIWVGIFSIVKK